MSNKAESNRYKSSYTRDELLNILIDAEIKKNKDRKVCGTGLPDGVNPMDKRFNSSDILVCPKCGTRFSADYIDRITYKKCEVQRVKDTYISITLNMSAAHHKEDKDNYFYYCDSCYKYSQGYKWHAESC